MTEVISVRFKNHGKSYYFAHNGESIAEGDSVVVETSKGLELGICARAAHTVSDERVVHPLRPVIRVATDNDMRVAAINKQRESEALTICQRKIEEHGLDMKLVDVECSFEGNKITFYFTSDGRVDFRELVKDLAGVFRNRIELRQIGVRDEAKMLGGIGICGRPYCCSQFLDDFQPVSTKMAKVQNMSLNPTKISGSCGRLMCCLRYEQAAYEDLTREVPKVGAFIETPAGYGSVTSVNLLRRTVKVRIDGDTEELKSYVADEIAVIPGGRPRPGEPLPQILKYRPAPVREEPEEEDDFWHAPSLIGGEERFVVKPESETPAEVDAREERPRRNGGGRRGGRGGRRGKGEERPQSAEAAPKNQSAKPQNPKPQSAKPQPGARSKPAAPQKPRANKADEQGDKPAAPKKKFGGYRRHGRGGGKPRPPREGGGE